MLKKFNEKMDTLIGNSKKGGADAYGFMNYLTGKEMNPYIQVVKVKPTKKKPLSFERLNMVIMTIIQYFESEIEASKNQSDQKTQTDALQKWIKTITGHQNLSVNTQFESMLNIYLVLNTLTTLKTTIFLAMVNFLTKHN